MDIFNTTRREIRCINNSNNVIDGGNSHLLEVGKVYHLDDIEVYSYFTYVYLEEFPGRYFNSVLFEEID